MSRLEIVVMISAVLLLVTIVEIVRRRRLSENWAMFWVGVACVVFLVGLIRPLIDRFAEALGIAFGTSLVFSVGIVFLLFVSISLSMHVSRLEDKVETLAQEVALLRGAGEVPSDLAEPRRESIVAEPPRPPAAPDEVAEPPTA
jgi:hypothetical protein